MVAWDWGQIQAFLADCLPPSLLSSHNHHPSQCLLTSRQEEQLVPGNRHGHGAFSPCQRPLRMSQGARGLTDQVASRGTEDTV